MPAQRIFALCGLCNILVVSSQSCVKVRKGGLPGVHFLLHGERRFGFALHRQHQAGAIPFGFDFAPGVGRNNAQHTRVPGGCQTALLHLAAKTQKRLVRAKVELQTANTYDYFVINDTVERAVREINAIMLAEHCKPAERMAILSE